MKDRPRPGQRRKLSGKQEALVCSSPPQERARWSLRRLADKIVELGFAESLCQETVRQVLEGQVHTL